MESYEGTMVACPYCGWAQLYSEKVAIGALKDTNGFVTGAVVCGRCSYLYPWSFAFPELEILKQFADIAKVQQSEPQPPV